MLTYGKSSKHSGHSLAATAATRRHSRNRSRFFCQRTSPVPEPRIGFPKNVTIRAGTSINLVLKFQVDRACFHGEEAGDQKRRESGKKKKKEEKEKERIEQ